MASYENAYIHLKQAEGGYSNHPNDKGGETYNGISRVHFPNWLGWTVIDSYKGRNKVLLNTALMSDETLTALIKAFYKDEFWDRMKLDQVNSQIIANNMFIFGINARCKRAVKFAQKIVGAKVDGIIGTETIGKLNAYDENEFKELFDLSELAFYKSIVDRDSSQRVFERGWHNRVYLV